MARNQPSIGCWITIGHPVIAEILAEAGFDWLTIDLEHSAITLHDAQILMQVIDGHGVTPLVRVSENDPTLIKRVMDCGAHGVIVPMVNSADDARRAVSAVQYPPHGYRGVGLARAQAYGAAFPAYAARLPTEAIVIAQVEHIESVRNLETILNTPGIDGIIIGPYDLSASLGVPGEFEHPEVRSALDRVELICRKRGKAMGFHVIPPNAEQLVSKLAHGYTFLGFSLDILFLGETCRGELAKVRSVLQQKGIPT